MLTTKEIIYAQQLAGGLAKGLSEEALRNLVDTMHEHDIQSVIEKVEGNGSEKITQEELAELEKRTSPTGWITDIQHRAMAAHYYRLLDDVISTGKRIGVWKKSRPLVATRLGGDVAGFACRGEDGQAAIIVDNGMTIFVHLLAKFIIDCCSKGDGFDRAILLDADHFREQLQQDENFNRIFQLLNSFCIQGNPALTQRYFPREDSIRGIDSLRDSVQMFIIAHECGHIQNGDLEDPMMNGPRSALELTRLDEKNGFVFMYRHHREKEADRFAANILINSIDIEDPLDVLKLAGPMVFFIALDLVDRFVYFLTFREDRLDTPMGALAFAGGDFSNPTTHPSPFTRLRGLRDELMNADGIPDHFKAVLSFFGSDVHEALSSTRIEFQEEHKKTDFYPKAHQIWQSTQVGFMLQRKFGQEVFDEVMRRSDEK